MRVFNKVYRSRSAPLGHSTCLALDGPPEFFIQRVIVKQVGGVAAAFSVRVYNSARACGPGSMSLGVGDPNGPEASPENYLVLDAIPGAAGKAALYITAHGIGYRNMDGDWAVPQKKIYVEIDAVGSGTATWDITIGGWINVGTG